MSDLIDTRDIFSHNLVIWGDDDDDGDDGDDDETNYNNCE